MDDREKNGINDLLARANNVKLSIMVCCWTA